VRRLPSDAPIFHTLAGRLFLLSSVLLLVLFVVRQFVQLPEFLELFRRVVSLASLGSLGWLTVLTFTRNRRAFLWRVRRRLILSYVFIGVIPLVLVFAFVLTGSMLVYLTVVEYVFQRELKALRDVVQQVAVTAGAEAGRNPFDAEVTIGAHQRSLARDYSQLSLAVVSATGASGSGQRTTAGPWAHQAPPATIPSWVVAAQGFAGALVVAVPGSPGDVELVIRAVSPAPDLRRFVVVDLPIDRAMVERLLERSGTGLGRITATGCGATATDERPAARQTWSLFRETVSFMDCTRWDDGARGDLSMSVQAPLAALADRLALVRSSQVQAALGGSWWDLFVPILGVLGVLFLIIQGSALVMGGVLAKSITSAVHELFVGTERIQQGDFAHRIRIDSQDQLGDLAGSFNRMSESIEYLLLVQREKQRLDDELRIAREIQKSLLPTEPPKMPGIDLADLCEPAREVGGDYYDFFEVGPRQLAVLVADVSGKGTSAALYMAELKGLVLALSHAELSPRKLLVDLNRLLADHLDNRSFITMTYAVIDLEKRVMTSARAGHTPLIVVSGGKSEVIASDGMVLGLRLPGAGERFEQILEEHTRCVQPGDVVVFYTDGVTEAMDRDGELFGDAALARVVCAHCDLDAAGIRERVVRDVKAFVGDAEPHDDMTMVVIKIGDEAA